MDKNHTSYCDLALVSVDRSNWETPKNSSDFDDILKFSNCSDASIKYIDFVGAPPKENWIDAVRGEDMVVRYCNFGSAGVSAITIKGGFHGWDVRYCGFSPCKRREIEVGQFDNYWYPGRPPTSGGVIAYCFRSDSSDPVRVTCWDAEPPVVIGGYVKITKVPKWIWVPYFLFRYACIRLFK